MIFILNVEIFIVCVHQAIKDAEQFLEECKVKADTAKEKLEQV